MREWLTFSTQCHRLLISSWLPPSKKDCKTNPSRERKNAAVSANWISRRKTQSLHSQKSPQWTEQMHFKKEKNCYFEWYKKSVYADPKSALNILTNLIPNPARVTTLCYMLNINTSSWQERRVALQMRNHQQWKSQSQRHHWEDEHASLDLCFKTVSLCLEISIRTNSFDIYVFHTAEKYLKEIRSVGSIAVYVVVA